MTNFPSPITHAPNDTTAFQLQKSLPTMTNNHQGKNQHQRHPTTSTNTPATKISIGSACDEMKSQAEANANAQEDKINAITNRTEMKDESVRPEQKFPRRNSSMMRNGAPSLATSLLLNITLLCTFLIPTLSRTRTALMLSAQAVQWLVITAEQIGHFDVEGSKGHGAAESPDIIPFRTWDVWLTEPTAQACIWR